MLLRGIRSGNLTGLFLLSGLSDGRIHHMFRGTSIGLLVILTVSACSSSGVRAIASKTGRSSDEIVDLLSRAKPAGQSVDEFAETLNRNMPDYASLADSTEASETTAVRDQLVALSCIFAEGIDRQGAQDEVSQAVGQAVSGEDLDRISVELRTISARQQAHKFYCDLSQAIQDF